jgi:hypothetical protein
MTRYSLTGDAIALSWASVDGNEEWTADIRHRLGVFHLCSAFIPNNARLLASRFGRATAVFAPVSKGHDDAAWTN